MKETKAQVGIGVLILFISALFVTAIAASVLISTTGGFQAKARTTGDQTRKDVSSMFFVMDVVGSDGTDGNIEYLKQIIKLPPGSEPVNMDYMTLVLSSETISASLDYRGVGGKTSLGNDGFNTWIDQELGAMGDYYTDMNGIVLDDVALDTINLDLDFDGANEQMVVCRPGRGFCDAYDGTHILIRLSSAGDYIIPLRNTLGASLDLTVKNGELFDHVLTPIGSYGYITIEGNENVAAGSYTIDGDNVHLFVAPQVLNEDLDDDSADDSIVINDTHLIVHYSSKGNISQQLNARTGVAYPLGADLSSGAQALNTIITLTDNESTTTFATINLSGSTSRASFIDENVQILVQPEQINKGYYTISYPQKSSEYQEGILRDGDIIRLYYESPKPLLEDEKIIVTLMTRSGTTTRTEFYMPNIISSETATLYP